MRHIISPTDLSISELDELLGLAEDIISNPVKYSNACHRKKLATLFYEPSTRTRLSFEAAMLNLGGSILGFSSADSSSATKGESIADTIRVISSYADICAIRHPKEGAPYVASLHSSIPVINAGDGVKDHPSQSLLDLMTIKEEFNTFKGIKVAVIGDIIHSRVAHTNIEVMERLGMECYISGPKEYEDDAYRFIDLLYHKQQKKGIFIFPCARLSNSPFLGLVSSDWCDDLNVAGVIVDLDTKWLHFA